MRGALDVLAGADADLGGRETLEAALAQGDSGGECGDGEVRPRLVGEVERIGRTEDVDALDPVEHHNHH